MIKCNITACGTIGRDASMRTTKEEKTFLTFPLRVVLQGSDPCSAPQPLLADEPDQPAASLDE